MSNETLQVGDTVHLKSGGPTMTVEWIGPHHVTNITVVQCKWFDKSSKLITDTFAPATLQKTETK